jgi:short-subunit dehydrogenase
MNLKNFRHKNILITGAGSGIGEALAHQLSATETNLYLAGRNRERLASVRDKCNAISNRCSAHIFGVDLSDPASIDRFISDLTKQNLTFDYIFLNAGISQRAPALATRFSVDRQIMETNYFGPTYLTKSLLNLPLVSDSKCQNRPQPEKTIHIIITSSISGLFGFPLRSAYSASKHALFGFFESLELENDHIKVTFLIPGRINTPISKSAIQGDGSPYSKMDNGQATGMDVNKCARIALRAISKEKHRKLIGGKELLLVYIKKFIPTLFYKLARKVSAT